MAALRPLEDGYAILLSTPMDMPFLLRFALEGLRHVSTENCKQILVVPDAWGTDGGAALRRVVEQFDDPRIAMAPPRPIDYRIVRVLNNSANTLWVAIVNGTAARAVCVFHPARRGRLPLGGRRPGATVSGVPRSGECTPWACRPAPIHSSSRLATTHIAATWEVMYSVDWCGATAHLCSREDCG